jgi:hypothetical protein
MSCITKGDIKWSLAAENKREEKIVLLKGVFPKKALVEYKLKDGGVSRVEYWECRQECTNIIESRLRLRKEAVF